VGQAGSPDKFHREYQGYTAATMDPFVDRFWQSRDGLKLHYRDYPGRDDRPPVLCLPGLTRNARDFEALAARLCGEWRVICPDMRGRGDSAYAKDSASYNVPRYIEDVRELLTEAQIARFAVIGTSMGGLMTMAMAPTITDAIAGAVLNDIGPEIEAEGLERIRGYVGQGRSFSTWMHAARALEESQNTTFPDYGISDWLTVAKRIMALGGNGRIVFDYDMKIAEPLSQVTGGAQPNLWDGLTALANRPMLFVRGALSDLFSEKTLAEMQQLLPEAEAVVIPRVGHAPNLQEPEAVAAVDALLAKVAAHG
jgi:pimeloyl-ACP methyl ester carboxylesterase